MLRTAFTRLMAVDHPIASAPMGGSAGGRLVAAVSNGGGLGLLGAGRGDPKWLARELALVVERTSKPWGVGFLTWATDRDAVAWTLDRRPAAVMLSFGDPTPYAELVREAGAKLILQVTDLDEARQALDVGADVIVAQGDDAGGHGGAHALGTMSFVPSVVDLAGPTPVLAAGGIVDGRGVAAALALGAAGALIGTRFQASQEALVPAETSKALLDGHGHDTERSRRTDIARGSPWPEQYPARTLRTSGPDPAIPIWAGQAVGLITSIEPAQSLMAGLAADAEQALRRNIGSRERDEDGLDK